ncbi:hypothetical protein GWI33_009658 [Rhynchophorus ferrugineus]|uniref:Peptidase S1 domain-containing protein n=1 Tax=Rhynchophorus ferrugineus TaxID=354439 RepID=A0A834MAR6_RHYFE|nr:hypothetical protein GWI33_009658 [Rhynchophorus ferrugineus]
MIFRSLVFLWFVFITSALGNKAPPNDTRIVGGVTVDIENHRYQGSLQRWNRHICGVTLISTRWVLTAAHCTVVQISDNPKVPPFHAFTVRFGSSYMQSEGFVYSVSRVIDHPSYEVFALDNDVSLLQLSRDVEISSTIEPIALIDENQALVPGSTCTITGWGAVSFGGPAAAVLQRAFVPLISQETCNEYYTAIYQYSVISKNMICAGSPYGGRDACQLDSGGPLVNNGVLVGVVSWGYQCARPQAPGVYASVLAYRQWIRETTGI